MQMPRFSTLIFTLSDAEFDFMACAQTGLCG